MKIASRSSSCASAYTPHQIARAILEHVQDDPNVPCKTIASAVRAKRLYLRQPPYSHYRSIRTVLLRHFTISRAVDMAILEGYADALRGVGHKVEKFTCCAAEMREQRIKAARHIFEQCKKANDLSRDASFNAADV